LCCVVLCCVVLCCVVLCCVVLCCVVLCYVVLCYVILCYIILYYIILYYIILYYIILYKVFSWFISDCWIGRNSKVTAWLTNLRHYPGICQERVRKLKKASSVSVARYHSRDTNRAPSQYISGSLPVLLHSRSHNWYIKLQGISTQNIDKFVRHTTLKLLTRLQTHCSVLIWAPQRLEREQKWK